MNDDDCIHIARSSIDLAGDLLPALQLQVDTPPVPHHARCRLDPLASVQEGFMIHFIHNKFTKYNSRLHLLLLRFCRKKIELHESSRYPQSILRLFGYSYSKEHLIKNMWHYHARSRLRTSHYMWNPSVSIPVSVIYFVEKGEEYDFCKPKFEPGWGAKVRENSRYRLSCLSHSHKAIPSLLFTSKFPLFCSKFFF